MRVHSDEHHDRAPPVTATVREACGTLEVRAFDFLLGDWRSTDRDASGKVMATGTYER